ncbi:MAG: sodium:calcium antiporter [Deltaproteobacteria bacterium]|nr:sodium:calcium antiporter [Candidatus Anaeroferrophillus wilburensis]MBN2889362.1 sodium:calcium antiporter [Deltaproteobacteria bacterium]
MAVVSWFSFLASAACILYAGRQLTRHGEELAEQTGLTRGFIGVILLGFITSLPELFSTIGAAALVHSPNLALGNIFGSNACNLAILALLEIGTSPRGGLQHTLNRDNLLTAFLSLIMVAMAAMAILVQAHWHLGSIDYFTVAIGFTYIAGLRMLYNFQNLPPADSPATTNTVQQPVPGKKAAELLKKKILPTAVVIVIAALVLSYAAENIARTTGWGSTFVGNVLLAVATSLPEMVVTFSAIKLGSFALAAGNIFGSNIFNIAILVIADLCYFPRSLYAEADPGQILIALMVILISSVYLFSSFYGVKRKVLAVRLDSLAVLTIYALGIYLLFIL